MLNEAQATVPKQQTRLILLIEHVLFRESLAHLLASEPHFDLVAQSDSVNDPRELLKHTECDIVLLDHRVGSQRGDEFIQAARSSGYRGKFLIVTPNLDASASALALKAGASGVFLHSGSSARLIQAIHLAMNGEVWVDPQVIQALADRYPAFEEVARSKAVLNSRQQTVLDGVTTGLTNRTIAQRMGLSEGTVKATLQQLFDKAGVRTRSQLVRVALSSWNVSESAV